MNAFDKKITLPDLRFEKSFLRSLQRYADSSVSKQTGPLSDSELTLLDDQKATGLEPEELKPIGMITPGVVTYAVIKDIVLRPLLEGFSWALIVILFRPTLRLVSSHGYRVGHWIARILGGPPTKGF